MKMYATCIYMYIHVYRTHKNDTHSHMFAGDRSGCCGGTNTLWCEWLSSCIQQHCTTSAQSRQVRETLPS